MKKLFIYVFPLFLLLGSCEKYLDVNHNVDAPAEVDGFLYLANITQQYQGIYWDIRALGPMTQMMGTTSYTSFANHYYSLGSDAGGEIWRVVYWNQGMNLENLINQSMEEEHWTLAGVGLAMKAFSWDMLTKVHGEVPMTDAFVPGLLSHDYDYQDAVYEQVRAWAYEAIELLERQDDNNYGSNISDNDFIYQGDKSKWIKFAYAVIVRNLASLTNKTNFTSDYAQELIDAAGKSFQNAADDATVSIVGGSQSAPYSGYNNFWGTSRNNFNWDYFQHEYAVQVMTGTVPEYDQATGDKIRLPDNDYHPYRLADKQIITDTLMDQPGHFDPRVTVKLSTTSNPTYLNLDDADSIKAYEYYGGSFTGRSGPIGTAPNFYGREATSTWQGNEHDGIGRWLYRDDAPYILTTYAEIQFCLAEAYWKLGQQAQAFEAFKNGVRGDMETAARYIDTGREGSPTGGDKIEKGIFTALGEEYLNGPYVGGLNMADFSLSHIMMQKWVALYPWGAPEAWVDMRKYHYDVEYTGDYPSNGNGWIQALLEQKWDSDPTKVYKGLFMAPAQVQGRKSAYAIQNEGSPSYRLRPRYNSEYMWNLESLESLKPISGTADNYQTSIPWFAYPGDIPTN
ncbi:SusD/RagB family nutrient-binding outer membrane lipoprotein [Parapedobacter sp. 2B3]|uniref:SusD/RagB family nutrient-binding outer membrane lipoprotein n=1 Tax=Parapedobacter sp. 2B3 TaxID=3342381 RepID=UPI0035B5CD64